jgi:hypothetical protein
LWENLAAVETWEVARWVPNKSPAKPQVNTAGARAKGKGKWALLETAPSDQEPPTSNMEAT